ncbi:MAG: hypothetical protein SOW06_08870 [Succinivibrionaceae bacterium]|nr:hypothetical protein [Pseudomonadota bacterium]MDY3145465.1 hypothetical protein [Succinivibrionaceae bacterium]
MAEYILMNKDTEVLPFSIVYDSSNFCSFIADKPLGRPPLGFKDIGQWIEDRMASRHSRFMAELMNSCGLRKAEDFIRVSHAVSLNDTFWVRGAGDNVRWKDVSPYSNDFDEEFSKLVFDGSSRNVIRPGAVAPELTAAGRFRKCFRRENGEIYMYKRGSSGRRGAGTEPYCEIIGSSVAEKLCRNSVHYDLVTLHGEIATRCRLFTSEKYGYAPFSVFMKGHTLSISEAVSFFERLGQESADTFRRMMVIDALTFNRDRHAGNFGVLFDNDTLEPVRMAPVFDMNLSMLAGFTEQELEKPGAFISRLSPSFSGVSGFLTLGRAFLNPEIRKDLADTGRLTADIGPEGVMTQNMLSCLEKILNLQRDALLSGKYSAESEVFVPGVSIDKL